MLKATCAHWITFNAQKFYKSPNPQKQLDGRAQTRSAARRMGKGGVLTTVPSAIPRPPPPSPTQTLPCPFLYSPPLPLQGWSNLGFNAQAGFTLSCGGCCQFLAAGMRPLPAILTQSTLLPTVFLSPSDSFPVSCDPFWGTLISHHGFLNQNSRKVTSV